MLNEKTVAVVVPAYNEETQISMVIETMPSFVDRIVIVNDKSKDKTEDVVVRFWQSDYNKSDIELNSNLEKEIQPTIYNTADIVVHNENIKELQLFTKHSVRNANPSKDRIILINHIPIFAKRKM